MSITFPGYRYNEALKAANLEICQKVFAKISELDSRLHYLLLPKQCVTTKLRNSSNFSLPKCRTDRYKKYFFPAMAYILCNNNCVSSSC